MKPTPYKSTCPPDATITVTDVAPTKAEIAHRMVLEMQAEPDAHKRTVARTQLIAFLAEGSRILQNRINGKE